MKKEEIRNLFNSLIDIHQKLLSLPKDILSSIDPQDIEGLEKTVKFLKIFNNNLEDFIEATKKIIENLKEYLSPIPESEPPGTYGVLSLYDNFTFKKPYGFILEGFTYKGIYTWKSWYIKVLEVLKEKNTEKFNNLPEEELFTSRRGKSLFTRNKNELRVAERANGFYTEVNLSANDLRKIVIKLLKYFSINPDDMKVYIKRN
jgi:hypothetical protein